MEKRLEKVALFYEFCLMQQAPHCMNMRKDMSMGDGSLIDSMMEDGLKDAIGKYVMGDTAENVAQQYQITRQQQV